LSAALLKGQQLALAFANQVLWRTVAPVEITLTQHDAGMGADSMKPGLPDGQGRRG